MTKKKEAEGLARDIVRLRIAQMLVNEHYKMGKFKVPIHLALGHETIAVTLTTSLKTNDALVLSHRNIAYNLARTKSFKKILTEYFLGKEGLAEGKLGSMNLADPRSGIIYSSSILGNNFPVASGIALARKKRGDKSVTFVLGGDGSMEEGAFYESLVLAHSLELPIVFIIENNEWSMATQIHERRKEIRLDLFAKSIGVTYQKLSGNNPLAYMKALAGVRKRAEKKGPVLLEVTLQTLGDWMTEDGPGKKRVVNYHAGPTKVVDMKHPLLFIRESSADPLHTLKRIIGEKKLSSMIEEEKTRIEKEIA